jgi:hypothetical protein
MERARERAPRSTRRARAPGSGNPQIGKAGQNSRPVLSEFAPGCKRDSRPQIRASRFPRRRSRGSSSRRKRFRTRGRRGFEPSGRRSDGSQTGCRWARSFAVVRKSVLHRQVKVLGYGHQQAQIIAVEDGGEPGKGGSVLGWTRSSFIRWCGARVRCVCAFKAAGSHRQGCSAPRRNADDHP